MHFSLLSLNDERPRIARISDIAEKGAIPQLTKVKATTTTVNRRRVFHEPGESV